MEIRELHPVNGQKSFYGKAVVLTFADGTEILRSYDTQVLKRTPTGKYLRMWDGWSATTGKHIKAFSGLNKAGFDKLPFDSENFDPEWMLSVGELLDFAREHGKAAAASLLLLTPPDRFAGDYEAMFAKLSG